MRCLLLRICFLHLGSFCILSAFCSYRSIFLLSLRGILYLLWLIALLLIDLGRDWCPVFLVSISRSFKNFDISTDRCSMNELKFMCLDRFSISIILIWRLDLFMVRILLIKVGSFVFKVSSYDFLHLEISWTLFLSKILFDTLWQNITKNSVKMIT